MRGVIELTELHLHGRAVSSVFGLLGYKENDLTASLGWALTKSPTLLGNLLSAALVKNFTPDGCIVTLQEHRSGGGYTDIEVKIDGLLHIIVEAKRGWNLPDISLLNRYAPRLADPDCARAMIVLSECSREFSELHLPDQVMGIPVTSLSWRDIVSLSEQSRNTASSHQEKQTLAQLIEYLKGVVTMQNQQSNKVYVVAVSSGIPENSTISWIDIIEKQGRYFHPIGVNGWPAEPPNYIAFRYKGGVCSPSITLKNTW